jgi:hypothetical protein
MGTFRTVLLVALSVPLLEPVALSRGFNTALAEGSSESLESLAGEYFLGTGFVNESLVLAPEGRASLAWWADDGERSEVEGRAEVIGRQLVVHPSGSKSNRDDHNASDRKLISVRWGKRLYLIPSDGMLSFCNAINLGLEPRSEIYGQFFVRITRGKTRHPPVPAGGSPGLLPPWDQFLLKTPLQGIVTDVVREGIMTVSLGSKDGIRVGMELWVEEAVRPFAAVTVVDVRESECTAKSNYKRTDDRQPHYDVFPGAFPKPAKGHRVSSRIPSAARKT